MNREQRKLVRDHIPEILRAEGYMYETEEMDEEEYRQALRQKLVEEACEAATAEGRQLLIMELADLREVMDALMSSYELAPADVQAEQERRRSERGGFDQRIRLIWMSSPQEK